MQNQNYKFCPRAQYVSAPVVIDGFSRSGKFLLAHIIGSLNGLEAMQSPLLMETALYLTRLGKLDLDTAKIMVQTDIDMNTYNMAIGRGLNYRIEDASCIYKTLDFGRFIARTTVNDPDVLLEEFKRKNLLPLFIGHECLCNISTVLYIFPKIQLVNLQRDPVALITSWYRRGWGKRWGVDPKSASIGFSSPSGSPAPWFAVDWDPEYSLMGEMDRCVKSIETLSNFAKDAYELLTEEQKSRIHFVSFGDILSNPSNVISGISNYLGRLPHQEIASVLARERVPRVIPEGERANLIFDIKEKISNEMLPILDGLICEFDGYWMDLVQKSSLKSSAVNL